jgi:rubredoxin
MQRWICTICQYVYNPAEGDLDNDIPPGTPFFDLLNVWTCPVCKAAKSFFVPYPSE